jgi:hypothetical protein
MPQTEITIYKDDDGSVPLIDWLDAQSDKVQDDMQARIELLAEKGNELRRPVIGHLRDGICELRKKRLHINYRILYGFCGKNAILLSHGCTKEGKVPNKEIDKAISNLNKYQQNPEAHTYYEETGQ